jgi:hypothetical protein
MAGIGTFVFGPDTPQFNVLWFLAVEIGGKWTGKNYLDSRYRDTHKQVGLGNYGGVPANIYGSFFISMFEGLVFGVGYVAIEQGPRNASLFILAMSIVFLSHYGQYKKSIHVRVQRAIKSSSRPEGQPDPASLRAKLDKVKSENSAAETICMLAVIFAIAAVLTADPDVETTFIIISGFCFFIPLFKDLIRMGNFFTANNIKEKHMSNVPTIVGNANSIHISRRRWHNVARWSEFFSYAFLGSAGYLTAAEDESIMISMFVAGKSVNVLKYVVFRISSVLLLFHG